MGRWKAPSGAQSSGVPITWRIKVTNRALIASLQPELSTQVAKLTELTAKSGEAGDAPADAQVHHAALDATEATEVADSATASA